MPIFASPKRLAQSGILEGFATDSPSGANLIPAGVVATTWNPSDKGASINLSASNTVAQCSGGWNSVRTIYASDGSSKYYWEVTLTASGTPPQILVGISTSVPLTSTYQSSGAGYEFYHDATYYHNNAPTAYGTANSVGDVIMLAFDSAANKLWWGKNGTWLNSGDPAAGTNAVSVTAATYYACVSLGYAYSSTVTANFGATSMVYTAPSGFKQGFGS